MYNLFEDKEDIFQDFEHKGVEAISGCLAIESIRNVFSRNG